ncbi:hypothetical protein KDK95_12995 [Actinospica sp. MGRD01-02]|uniref:BD-FAE-like domain-containing protein n=1 Tax=Actinospica acidithermotolerans TaxID=2828514 RepID=A0A941EB72_9ACTN|nr:hypothetical protein [Actinospica acidithermotolerans]MBR7827227.1 hypothetical protein [Actinospica acidithermotolerans]
MVTYRTQYSDNAVALAAGWVMVEPGARGHDLVNSHGDYDGVAPAAIVDLKAATRYLKFNAGRVPGNTEQIVVTGLSAGGALAALQGASGDVAAYDPYLEAIGAAPASDSVWGVASYCPITDLDHADRPYEYCFGTLPVGGSTGDEVDQTLSAELIELFRQYQDGLNLSYRGFGALSADNYSEFLLKQFLLPAATRYLSSLTDAEVEAYLAANPGISYANGQAQPQSGAQLVPARRHHRHQHLPGDHGEPRGDHPGPGRHRELLHVLGRQPRLQLRRARVHPVVLRPRPPPASGRLAPQVLTHRRRGFHSPHPRSRGEARNGLEIKCYAAP